MRGTDGNGKTLAMLVAAVGIPAILAYVLVVADIRTDLSGLTPAASARSTATTLIGWRDLKRIDGQRTRMLGYRMDGLQLEPRKTDGLDMFILLPEPGHFFHPASRDPDQMVEVWLLHPAVLTYRSLVWVSGVLEKTAESPDPGKALYAMRDATVQPAQQTDITRWFRP